MSLITPLSFEFGDVRMVKVTLTGPRMSYASSSGRLWSTHQARQIPTKAITISRLPILNEACFVSFLNGFSSSIVSISIAPWISSSDKKCLKQDSQGEVTQIAYQQSQRAGSLSVSWLSWWVCCKCRLSKIDAPSEKLTHELTHQGRIVKVNKDQWRSTKFTQTLIYQRKNP